MRLVISLVLIFLCLTYSIAKKNKDEDFSEFDDFDHDEFDVETPTVTGATPLPSKTQVNKPEKNDNEEPVQTESSNTRNDEVTIDDDDDESMFDDEEFEASDTFASSSSSTPDLKIAEVPANLTGNRWEAYQCEAVMLIALLAYLINFLIGRTKNARLATIVYRSQRDLLDRNFSLVGDDGQTTNTQTDDQIKDMHKESDHLYILWCSGRASIESMLIELRLIKRQCAFNSVAAIIKSINDTIVYTIDFNKDDMETFVFCLAKKRSAAKLHRDMNDLSQFCVERKSADKKGLSSNYQILSEIGEASSAIIDSTKVADFIDKFPDALEYIYVSDQYTGMKSQNGEQQSSSPPPTTSGSAAQQQDALNASERSVRRVLIVAFNITAQNGRSLQVTSETIGSDYLRLVLHLIEFVSAFRFKSKELKNKAIKNRQRIEEQFLKSVNLQRQEQAQIRREDKRRAEKEKVMQSDDAELQRKWEEKEHKREMKRRTPKMKQMKMSFLTGTHRFLDPKCNEVLDLFYECIEKKSRAIGACDGLLAQLYRCKKEDLETHRKINKSESEQKRRDQAIARDPIIQKKLEILKRLQDKQKGESTSS
ncbi:unnamed protein product [Adineta steineri]|uniref:PAT complex subunit CCDC47 n=4 Tax=Adineta steineri TaxID=433720 RepID=A0A814S5Q0_9BILA|nr:unnamed protein product [Adineta steineri]CAF1086233.1 unnamed protein product [Adineta steineri]CAF1143639.1 unnamed protein product [Adineta steineri]